MEAVSVAASIATFGAVLGQIVSSTKHLYDFFSAVTDAPESMRWLADDLKLMQGLLAIIQDAATNHSNDRIGSNTGAHSLAENDRKLRIALLEKCRSSLELLEKSVKELRPAAGDRKAKMTWKSLKSAFQADKLKLYKENLESAKISLLLAQSYFDQREMMLRFDTFDNRVASLTTWESISQIPLSYEKLREEVKKSTALIMGLMPLSDFVQTLSSTLQTTVFSAVMDAVNNRSVVGETTTQSVHQRRIGDDETMETRFTASSCVLSEQPDCPRRLLRSRRPERHSSWHYNTPFGKIGVRTREHAATSNLAGADPKIHLSIVIIPRPWISKTAMRLILQWGTTNRQGLRNINIKFYPVVPRDSPILEACRKCDINDIQFLFDHKAATPHDITEQGANLVMYTIHWAKFNPNVTRTCAFLIQHGCEASRANYAGITPLDIVIDLCQGSGGNSYVLGPGDSEFYFELVRLLTKCGAEVQNYDYFLWTLVMLMNVRAPIGFPVLSHLVQQQALDLDGFKRSVQIGPKKPSPFRALLKWPLPCPQVFKALLLSGVTVSDIGLDEPESETLLNRLIEHMLSDFEDEKSQAEYFSALVLEFAILLDNGLKPDVQVPPYELGRATILGIAAAFDPDLTEVAWRLALKLTGFEAFEEAQENNTAMSAGPRKVEAENTGIRPPDSRMPGSWPDGDDLSQPEQVSREGSGISPTFPRKRRFVSRETDFKPSYRDCIWPEYM